MRRRRAFAWVGALVILGMVPALLTCFARRGAATLPPEQRAAYRPETVTRVALVEPKDFTSEKEAAIRIEDPVTGTLIRTLRTGANLEVLPGHLPLARDFVQAVRA